METIKKGLCQCGCGGKAPIASKNDKAWGLTKGEPKRFIHGHHRRGVQSPWMKRYGADNPAWKQGITKSYHGYIQIRIPDHPRSSPSGYVFEHILVMEQALGRYLIAGETPHHRDRIKTNNDIGNLILFKTNGMHASFHARLRAFESCEHWDWLSCPFCHQYDDPINLVTYGRVHCHRLCKNKYDRELRSKKHNVRS